MNSRMIENNIERAIKEYKEGFNDYAQGIGFGTLLGMKLVAKECGNMELYNRLDNIINDLMD